MPELPEVETVRRGLKRLVKGKVISKVEVTYASMVKTGATVFCQDLIGQEILDVDRRGKYLLIYLTDHVLISHLRMEGKYNFFPDQVPANKHFHAFLLFQMARPWFIRMSASLAQWNCWARQMWMPILSVEKLVLSRRRKILT